MEKLINKNFYEICYKDIKEILDEYKEVVPEYIEDFLLRGQAYYKEDDIVILCKHITDEDTNDKIGSSINVLFPNEKTSYKFEYIFEDNFISFETEKQVSDNEDLIVARKGIILENSLITRSFYQEFNGCTSFYDVGYDLSIPGEYQEYLTTPSLEETLQSIKLSKIKKRNK